MYLRYNTTHSIRTLHIEALKLPKVDKPFASHPTVTTVNKLHKDLHSRLLGWQTPQTSTRLKLEFSASLIFFFLVICLLRRRLAALQVAREESLSKPLPVISIFAPEALLQNEANGKHSCKFIERSHITTPNVTEEITVCNTSHPQESRCPLQRARGRDAKSRYPWRFIMLVVFLFAAVFVLHVIATAFLSIFPDFGRAFRGGASYHRYEHMFHNDSDFAYIPESAMMITTTAKAGSTAFWTWMLPGITGTATFDPCNNTYIQNFNAPCWQGKVVHPFNMTDDQRWRMVNRHEILRVAIIRNPYERLISAWKSKAACESDDFGTDVEDRDKIVPILLRQAEIHKQATCLSLTSFAQVLDKLRRMSLRGQFDIRQMNKHFRPQQSFFRHIRYDIILDVDQISNSTALAPIVRRLRFRDMMPAAPVVLHASPPSLQTISERTAALLYKFALLTEELPTMD